VIAETKPERAAWSAAIAKVEQLQTDAEKGFATPMRRVAVRTASVVWVKCRATSSPNIGTAYQNRRSSAQIAALFTPRCSTADASDRFHHHRLADYGTSDRPTPRNAPALSRRMMLTRSPWLPPRT
jgi:hypothetical protein